LKIIAKYLKMTHEPSQDYADLVYFLDTKQESDVAGLSDTKRANFYAILKRKITNEDIKVMTKSTSQKEKDVSQCFKRLVNSLSQGLQNQPEVDGPQYTLEELLATEWEEALGNITTKKLESENNYANKKGKKLFDINKFIKKEKSKPKVEFDPQDKEELTFVEFLQQDL